MNKSKIPFTLLLSACILAGCGGGDEPPSGTVFGTVTSNGAPVSAGQITFVSPTIGASGSAELSSDGTYEFEGPLPVGQYSVYLTASGLGDQPPSENPKEDKAEELNGIPKKYQSEQTTDLTAKIEEGKNDIPFQL